jgi:hypothetical protein
MELDMKNNSKKWQDAEETEMHQLLKYHCTGVAIDLPACEQCYSLFGGESTPLRSKFILKNLVTHNLIAWNARTIKEDSVNFETWFKRRLVHEGKDPVPEDWQRSKIKELGTSEYREQMAGSNLHQGFAEVLRAIGFIPSKAEADIWMGDNNNLYEYIPVNVDDLLIVARNPKEIVQTLEEQHKVKLKEVGPLTYHSGCDYFHDQDRTLCFGPRTYITKMMDQFKNMYGCKPKE